MDQLKGKVVNVVLTVQEGKGMDSLKKLVFISANFNGRILESDPVCAEDCPSFNTNLIWEIEKRDLRKIRSSNQPLRVECLSLDNQNRREKFGHVLMDLRSAQILEDATQVPYKWQKLIGVRNRKRNCCPELYLSLTIRNHVEEEEVEGPEEEISPAELFRERPFPVQYLDDGYIKVGDQNSCNEDLSLNILVKSASNLDLLLPEVLVFRQNKNKYCISVKIFGIPIKTKQFSKDLHNTVIFEEKIVVRLLSNIDILREFFKEEKIEVGFCCGSDLLGVSIVGFDGLVGVKEKIILNNCCFKFPSPNGIVPTTSDGRRPTLALEIYLLKNRKLEIMEDMKEEFKSLVATIVKDASKASGDYAEDQDNDSSRDASKDLEVCMGEDSSKASGDYVEDPRQEELTISEEKLRELVEWKEKEMKEFQKTLESIKGEEVKKAREEWERKKLDLDENVKRCRELQEELQEKLDELRTAKALRKKKKSSTSLIAIVEENQKKFVNCEKELLIHYISTLQRDNDNLKQIVNEQRQQLENIEKTALTKEQTANLLQELKGLEEKFEIAQQTKTYFKEQWKKACEEIHELKSEDYKQLQDQIREQREELGQLNNFFDQEPSKILSL